MSHRNENYLGCSWESAISRNLFLSPEVNDILGTLFFRNLQSAWSEIFILWRSTKQPSLVNNFQEVVSGLQFSDLLVFQNKATDKKRPANNYIPRIYDIRHVFQTLLSETMTYIKSKCSDSITSQTSILFMKTSNNFWLFPILCIPFT